MKDVDVHIRKVSIKLSVVTLYLTDNTIHRYSMNNIHEYVNQKTSSIRDLAEFQVWLDRDCWFLEKGRKPTLRLLAEEYSRAISADLDYPITILRGVLMLEGATTPEDGRAILDGTHRLLKCLITGKNTVNVVEVTVGELLQHVEEID